MEFGPGVQSRIPSTPPWSVEGVGGKVPYSSSKCRSRSAMALLVIDSPSQPLTSSREAVELGGSAVAAATRACCSSTVHVERLRKARDAVVEGVEGLLLACGAKGVQGCKCRVLE